MVAFDGRAPRRVLLRPRTASLAGSPSRRRPAQQHASFHLARRCRCRADPAGGVRPDERHARQRRGCRPLRPLAAPRSAVASNDTCGRTLHTTRRPSVAPTEPALRSTHAAARADFSSEGISLASIWGVPFRPGAQPGWRCDQARRSGRNGTPRLGYCLLALTEAPEIALQRHAENVVAISVTQLAIGIRRRGARSSPILKACSPSCGCELNSLRLSLQPTSPRASVSLNARRSNSYGLFTTADYS